MNEEMMTTGFTGGDTATGPTAGFDPVMKLRAKVKDLKGLVAPGNKLSTSNKKKVKSEGVVSQVKKGVKRHKDAVQKKKIKDRKAVPYAALAAEHEPEGKMVEGKGWQPEIEHSKLGDAKKKKDKEKESKLPPHLQGDAIAKMRKAFASTNEAIAPSPQEIQVHKKISMLQQKLAQLRKKTVNQAAKAGSAAKTADAEVTSENYEYVAEKRKTKINLKPTTKDQKGEGKFINRYNPRYLPYVEENDPLRPSHAAPNKLFQYKVKLPEVGETIVYANSPAELMIKLRLLVNPRLRGGIKIDRILPYDAYKFYTDKRAKALRRK